MRAFMPLQSMNFVASRLYLPQHASIPGCGFLVVVVGAVVVFVGAPVGSADAVAVGSAEAEVDAEGCAEAVGSAEAVEVAEPAAVVVAVLVGLSSASTFAVLVLMGIGSGSSAGFLPSSRNAAAPPPSARNATTTAMIKPLPPFYGAAPIGAWYAPG
jgi:hypothetical protein